jgi:hypothetical protein
MIIYEQTAKTERDKQRSERESAISVAGIQLEMLIRHFAKRREVPRSIYQRLVQSVIKIGAHLSLTVERVEEFEKKLRNAAPGDHTISMQGNRMYIQGYFDLDKLKKEVMW